ncbi:acetate--CoA ligase family protein [Natronolimnohabitans innermongolicus]|uniref:acetate--CoA ligase (ADP-forming) n=1 Tax=Natronolimnohabitans innermongolicus JCM 12255 TaxID=1227499 RepID=L9WRG0_9EURY|nr:acetate--CoA ligase family protein [Natronolimnohabitans innermongolicus]ELY50908.1 acetyl-CoA synthetase I subunit beta [Natronolimnohabitans innermongolicus JCM 12255]
MTDISGIGRSVLETARDEQRTALTEAEAKGLLAERGLSVPDHETVDSPEAAVEAAEEIGYPVVAKVSAPSVQHKSEWGGGVGVAVGLENPESVRTAAADIFDAANGAGIDASVLVEEGADLEAGLEVIVGGTRDPSFGPTVLVGLGGITVEVLQDTSHRIAPVSTAEAVEMTRELEASPLFDGYRGSPAVDREAVAEAIVAVGDVLDEHESIREIEINPLLAESDRAVALDALVSLDDD